MTVVKYELEVHWCYAALPQSSAIDRERVCDHGLFCVSCVAAIVAMGAGCPIYRTDIQMVMRYNRANIH